MQKPKERKIQYIRLSEEGKKKYVEISKQAYFVFGLWMFSGILGGYMTAKLLPKIPFLSKNYYIRKYKFTPFFVVFMTLSYHGYKLMQFNKRKGIRQLSKDPVNLWSQPVVTQPSPQTP